MSDINSEPGAALAGDAAKATAPHTSFAGRIRNYFLTGLVVAFIVLTLLGFLTANLVGRTLVELGESLLNRMPIVRPIYKTMKQIFESLFSKTGSSFRKVALVEFPAPGMWSLVFLSQPPGGDVIKSLPQ